MIQKRKLNPAAQIVLGFLGLILIGTFLLCLPISAKDGKWFSFVDSFLTSTSAVCVTGLVVVDTAVHFSIFGQAVILLLIQCGGLGFIALTSLVFLLLGKRITYGARITIQESLNQDKVQGVVKLIKNIIITVFVIEFLGFVCLSPSMISLYGWGDGLFKALFLAISAFCNAGFDNLGTVGAEFTSISSFAQNTLILLPIILLIVIGGIGFVVIFDIGKRFKGQKLALATKIVLISTAILIFGGALILAAIEWNNPDTLGKMTTWDKIINAFFLSISPRTAGFSTVDIAKLHPASIVITDILMFIGGSPGSTAGGVKTTTIFVLLLALFKNENNNGNISFRQKRISNKLIKKSTRVVFFAVLFAVIGTGLICIFDGNIISPTQAMFECISALSTVGLSLGVTPVLSVGSKLIITLLMFVGRVGALTLTLAIANRPNSAIKDIEYPDAKIMIG